MGKNESEEVIDNQWVVDASHGELLLRDIVTRVASPPRVGSQFSVAVPDNPTQLS